MVDLGAVQNLLAGWWFEYDQGNFDVWPEYFTPDAHFSCRSDSGMRRAPRAPEGAIGAITAVDSRRRIS